MFLLLWQFVIPLIIFVVAYWKIIGVVRRQAKVAADRQRTKDPVAGTSRETVKSANVWATNDNSSRVVTAGAEGGRVVGSQTASKTLSRAQINVVQTMVYIIVCFTLCWMPMYCYMSVVRSKVTEEQLFCLKLYLLREFLHASAA